MQWGWDLQGRWSAVTSPRLGCWMVEDGFWWRLMMAYNDGWIMDLWWLMSFTTIQPHLCCLGECSAKQRPEHSEAQHGNATGERCSNTLNEPMVSAEPDHTLKKTSLLHGSVVCDGFSLITIWPYFMWWIFIDDYNILYHIFIVLHCIILHYLRIHSVTYV